MILFSSENVSSIRFKKPCGSCYNELNLINNIFADVKFMSIGVKKKFIAIFI